MARAEASHPEIAASIESARLVNQAIYAFDQAIVTLPHFLQRTAVEWLRAEERHRPGPPLQYSRHSPDIVFQNGEKIIIVERLNHFSSDESMVPFTRRKGGWYTRTRKLRVADSTGDSTPLQLTSHYHQKNKFEAGIDKGGNGTNMLVLDEEGNPVPEQEVLERIPLIIAGLR